MLARRASPRRGSSSAGKDRPGGNGSGWTWSCSRAAGLVFWQQAQGGYELVLAPEGTPRVSVSYTSFLAPLLLWAGAALLIVRLTRLALGRNGRYVAPLLRVGSGQLARLVGASLSRQRGRVATGLALVALAIAFAVSTAIFNATYEAQSLVDAELTNGADVTVSGGQSADLRPFLSPILTLPGVATAEPMQHRFAYVGTDLQDLYGIDPASLPGTAPLSDAYFVGATAQEAMNLLATTPDGVLVSPETVVDFQLQPGDTIKLRLQSASDHQYHPVPFRFVGVAREFPTAPSDSFLVANATYVAQQTGSPAVETLLVRTTRSPAAVATDVRAVLGAASGATVRDIEAQRQITRSSLTALSLHGLTRLELGFALALAAAGAGVLLALGLAERRRTLAIATALGATPRQLGAFVWGEAGLILGGGVVAGALLGWAVAATLVKLLTHVFDPPPAAASVPWPYLVLVLIVTGWRRTRRGQHRGPGRPARGTGDYPPTVTADQRRRAVVALRLRRENRMMRKLGVVWTIVLLSSLAGIASGGTAAGQAMARPSSGESMVRRQGPSTQTAGGADPVLLAAGDIADCRSPGDEATADLIRTLPGTIATLGDNAYRSGSAQSTRTATTPPGERRKPARDRQPGTTTTARRMPAATSTISARRPETAVRGTTATTSAPGTSWSSTRIATPSAAAGPTRRRGVGCARTWQATRQPVPLPTGTTPCSAPASSTAATPRCGRSGNCSTTLGPTWCSPGTSTTTSGLRLRTRTERRIPGAGFASSWSEPAAPAITRSANRCPPARRGTRTPMECSP